METIIELYHAHGTMEQFHSEIKTDLDLERLPASSFATNDLVLHLGVFTYNLLRVIGQLTLGMACVPLRKKAQGRRLRTVIQNLITLASRLVRHARRVKLRLNRQNAWAYALARAYTALGSG